MTRQHIQTTQTIPPELAGLRLDQAAAKCFPEFSRARLQTWIREQALTLDNQPAKPRDKVQAGQQLSIDATLQQHDQHQAQAIALDVIYQDDAIIVINKPAGLVVHPGAGNPDLTLLNALLHFDATLATLPRAGIVHRLDKDTSGIMVVARSLAAHHALVDQLQRRQMRREYLAIVNGVLIAGGQIDAPIGRHPTKRIKMAVTKRGKPAITDYRVAERYRAHSLLKVRLQSGRTHQIRVHMAYIHHPLVGDRVYGGRRTTPAGISAEATSALRSFPRQALHAKQLELIHPNSQQTVSFSADLPADMQNLIEVCRFDAKSSKIST